MSGEYWLIIVGRPTAPDKLERWDWECICAVSSLHQAVYRYQIVSDMNRQVLTTLWCVVSDPRQINLVAAAGSLHVLALWADTRPWEQSCGLGEIFADAMANPGDEKFARYVTPLEEIY
jgi:hypothetical protein